MFNFSPLVRITAVLAASLHLDLALAATPASTAPAVTALMSKALPDLPGKEALMLTVVYPPGGFDPVHRHAAYGFIYVLEGTIVMGVRGGMEMTLRPGDTFYEGPDDVHTVGRNASRTAPAKFLVFLLKEEKNPAVMPVTH